MKKVFIIFLVLFFVFCGELSATDYYVSTVGNNSYDGTTPVYVSGTTGPWADPIYGAAQLVSGDALYIRVGEYSIPGGAGNNVRPQHSNITISNYNGEDVFLNGGAAPTGTTVVANGVDNITISGIRIKGCIYFYTTTGSVLENCEVWEGGDNFTGSTDFGELIYINTTTNCVIRNNKLHDNVYSEAGGGNNSPAIMVYDSTGLVIEKCDIYNSPMHGIYLKDNPETVIIRYCHIYDNAQTGIIATGQDQGNDVYIHNNIFRGNGVTDAGNFAGAIVFYGFVNNIQAYNNTMYGNFNDFVDGYIDGSMSIYLWNNISSNPSTYHISGFSLINHFTYSDYNDFYDNVAWRYERSDEVTLSGWQSASSLDSNSIVTIPGFTNAGGTLAVDYKRSSYPLNGRGGAYESVMGAWISGSSPDQIGYAGGGDTTTPPTASGLVSSGVTFGVSP